MGDFTQEEIDQILGVCEEQLKKMAVDEAVALAKGGNAPDEASEGSEGPAAPAPDTGDDGADASPPADEGSAPESAPADDGSASGPPPAAPEDGMPDESGEIHPAPTVEQLQAEFAALPDEQLRMMYLAAKAALADRMGQAGAAPGGAPGGDMGGAPPPPAGPEASAPPPAMKAEVKVHAGSKGSGGEMKLGKSEPRPDARVEALEKTLKEQDAALKQLAKVIATPIRKSVAGVSDLKWLDKDAGAAAPAAGPDLKSLSKAEVKQQLRGRIKELGGVGKLSKADREAVIAFDCGNVDVSKIEHLFQAAK